MSKQRVERAWCWHLREVMAAKGLSVSEVARRSGVSRSTVQVFCRDPLHDTTVNMWVRLARALDVPLTGILEWVSANEAPMGFAPGQDEKPLQRL